MHSNKPLSERAQGRWPGILPALGIDRQFLTNKHGPCPICGGKDRFRFDNKKGRGDYFCSQCGPGDGIKLLQKVKGWDFKELAQQVEGIIGEVKPMEVKTGQSEEEKRKAMNALWLASKSIQENDAAGKFLLTRIGGITFPRCLRFNAKVLYRHDTNSWHPAMIAMVTAPDGKPSILHRTYLTSDGRKADVPEARRMMPGTVAKGSAVRLMDHGPVLGIAEGIETALAASKLFDVPVWAALNASLLEQWEPPQGVKDVIVFADNDPNFAGQSAAFNLAKRLRRSIGAQVEVPSTPGEDWNDVLNARRAVP